MRSREVRREVGLRQGQPGRAVDPLSSRQNWDDVKCWPNTVCQLVGVVAYLPLRVSWTDGSNACLEAETATHRYYTMTVEATTRSCRRGIRLCA